MKTSHTLLFVLGVSGAALPSPAQLTLAEWTFETSVPSLTDSASISGLLAEAGVFAATATASGVHASASTDWSNPAGNGSNESFNSTNWAIGDYYEFTLATTGYHDLTVSFGQMRSGTGPASFQFAYSLDGVSFTDVGASYAVSSSSWTLGSYDLTAVAALENAAAVWFRLSATAAPSSTAGTARVDDFLVEGYAIPVLGPPPVLGSVPEPSTYGLLGVLVLGALATRRRLTRR